MKNWRSILTLVSISIAVIYAYQPSQLLWNWCRINWYCSVACYCAVIERGGHCRRRKERALWGGESWEVVALMMDMF